MSAMTRFMRTASDLDRPHNNRAHVGGMHHAHVIARRAAAAGGLAATLLLTGCAAATTGRATPARSQTSCTAVADQTLTAVAQRIYDQAAGGTIVADVTRRLADAPALSRAVAQGDPAATRRALRPLLKDQVVRLVVTGRGRTLATIGTTAALAPVAGTIRDTAGVAVGAYRLAVASDASVTGEISAVTGARVSLRAGDRPAPTTALSGTSFSGQPLTIALTMRAPTAAECGSSPGQTQALTTAAVAQRLFASETDGPASQRVARYVATDPRLVSAVVHDDPTALRAEIVHLFRDRRLHVVRIRAVTASGRLVKDVGGPYVLAPASRVLRSHGRDVGAVTLSVQDDTGYIKLIHRFTGAWIQLTTPAGVVPGSDSAPPTGTSWPVRFTVTGFPSGPLSVTLAA
jgi:hypothetical protein